MESKKRGPAPWSLVAVLGAGLVWACSGEAPAAAPPPPPPAPALVTPPEPQPTVVSAHFAVFGANKLLACLDYRIEIQPGSEPDGGVPSVERLQARIAPEGNDGGLRPIPQLCADQFNDRTIWAFCVIDHNEDGVRVIAVENHLDFGRAFDTDTMMQQCMEDSGRWTAVARDTPEWQRAQRQHQLEQLQQDARDAQGELDRALGRRRR